MLLLTLDVVVIVVTVVVVVVVAGVVTVVVVVDTWDESSPIKFEDVVTFLRLVEKVCKSWARNEFALKSSSKITYSKSEQEPIL